ncbi:MAG: hypothetical protein HYT43_00250 [Candidatus Taylorbacteria bacterium]|nr:hypothetical protein [Candidatus Taylorbacteria bacterium]
MREFQAAPLGRARARHYLYSWPVFILLLAALALSAKAALRAAAGLKESEETKRLSAEKFSALEVRQKALAAAIEHLRTKEGEEDEIRRKFRVRRPEEGLIILIEDEEPQSIRPRRRGFWRRLTEFFSRD